MTAALRTAPGRPVCRFCGSALDVHQAARGAVCAAEPCQRKRIQEASRAVFQRNWDDYVERQRRAAELAAPLIARALRRLKARPDRTAIGVVPHLDRPLVPLPPDRRAEFEARLDEIVANAFAGPPPDLDPDPARRAREEAPEHPLIAATCATCQGMCCTIGASQNAFLTESDIQRFRYRHPGAEAAAVRAHYLGRLPETSVKNSCVYQSAAGCTLDRCDRADICNRYHCNPQTQLLTRMREMKARKAVIVGHEGDMGPVVGTLDARSGYARLPDGRPEDGVTETEIAAARAAAVAQVPAPLPAPKGGGTPG